MENKMYPVSAIGVKLQSRRQGWGKYVRSKKTETLQCAGLHGRGQEAGINAGVGTQREGFKFCNKVHFYMFSSFKWML